MAVNKVIKGNTTLIDLTSDTATAADVAQGKTFHLADGSVATGSAVPATDNLPAWLSGNTVTSFSDATITAIKAYACYNNYGLASVSCPAVTQVGPSAFQNAHSLTTVSLPACTDVGDSGFRNSKVSSVNLNACTELGERAFASCDDLISIYLPALEYMNIAAFAGCYSTEEIHLGSSFQYFYSADYANEAQFYDCGSLQRLIIDATTPPRLRSSYLFGDTSDIPSGLGIYVPDSSVNAYKTATNWSVYASYIHSQNDLT